MPRVSSGRRGVWHKAHGMHAQPRLSTWLVTPPATPLATPPATAAPTATHVAHSLRRCGFPSSSLRPRPGAHRPQAHPGLGRPQGVPVAGDRSSHTMSGSAEQRRASCGDMYGRSQSTDLSRLDTGLTALPWASWQCSRSSAPSEFLKVAPSGQTHCVPSFMAPSPL